MEVVMIISISEFKLNTAKFLDLAKEREIILEAEEGALIRLMPVTKKALAAKKFTETWGGAFKDLGDVDIKEIREERIRKKYEITD
jgi:hypothetical protein